jgi:pimeloyl-ACP methyl ester carboxylesterase
MTPEPYRIAIPDAAIADLHRRLDMTRWAEDFGNEDWRYGVEAGWLRDMAHYWRHAFDWRRQEAEMNAWPGFRVELDGVPIHFLHIRGKGPNPMPLVLTHGWPWTFWDYRDLIGPLTDPAAHGLDPAVSFDLVIPSLPGYGFSTPLRKTGINMRTVADLWVMLMRDVLGYDRFGAAGGDWGAAVTSQLGHAHGEHLTGIYQTLVTIPGFDFADLGPDAFAEDEQWMAARNATGFDMIISHITAQSHDPQTLAYAFNDSPVGTAAWLWERRRAWSDWEGDFFDLFDRDALCTLASIYWFTGSMGSSFRLYRESILGFGSMANPRSHDRTPAIAVPSGFGIDPKEVVLMPRSVAAANTNLHHWNVLPRGGHFAPAEQPEIVTQELRSFFGSLR